MNTNESDFELIRCCRDGEATPEELAALESRLREDAAFREAYVRYVNLDAALETAVAAVEPTPDPPPAKIPVSSLWKQWFFRQPLSAAAGLAIGLFSASVAWAVALPRLAEARVSVKTIFSESFKSGTTATLPGLPRDCGVWSGDEATVVTAEQGVKPKSGGKMLRFLGATYPGENSPRSQWSDVYRLVDVRGLARAGRNLARLSASFAAAPVAAGEEYLCSVEAIALDHELSALPEPLRLPLVLQNGSATSSRKLPLVGNRQWQNVSVEVPISPQTQFVLLHLAVLRKEPVIQTGAVHFAGHYLDDVKLELVSRR